MFRDFLLSLRIYECLHGMKGNLTISLQRETTVPKSKCKWCLNSKYARRCKRKWLLNYNNNKRQEFACHSKVSMPDMLELGPSAHFITFESVKLNEMNATRTRFATLPHYNIATFPNFFALGYSIDVVHSHSLPASHNWLPHLSKEKKNTRNVAELLGGLSK